MLEALVILFGVFVLLGVMLALGAMGAFVFLALLLTALFLSRTLLILLTLLGLFAVPYLILRSVVRLCRGRKVPGTQIPVGAVVAAAVIIALITALPSTPPKMDWNMDRMLHACDGGSGVDITIDGHHYHFSCKSEDAPAEKEGTSM